MDLRQARPASPSGSTKTATKSALITHPNWRAISERRTNMTLLTSAESETNPSHSARSPDDFSYHLRWLPRQQSAPNLRNLSESHSSNTRSATTYDNYARSSSTKSSDRSLQPRRLFPRHGLVLRLFLRLRILQSSLRDDLASPRHGGFRRHHAHGLDRVVDVHGRSGRRL